MTPDPFTYLFVLWVGWRLMRIHQQWVDERRQKAALRLVVPLEPGRKRNTYHRTRQARKRPRH